MESPIHLQTSRHKLNSKNDHTDSTSCMQVVVSYVILNPFVVGDMKRSQRTLAKYMRVYLDQLFNIYFVNLQLFNPSNRKRGIIINLRLFLLLNITINITAITHYNITGMYLYIYNMFIKESKVKIGLEKIT